MLEDLIDTGVSHSQVRLSLEKSIDEISGLQRPIIRNLLFLDLYLLSQYLLPNFFARPTVKRTSSKHQLMCDDSNSKVISRVRVILPAKDLRRHVPWRSTCIRTIIIPERPSNPKISQPCKPLTIQHYIFRLDVAMDDSLRMQVTQPQRYAYYYKLCLLFVEPFSREVMA